MKQANVEDSGVRGRTEAIETSTKQGTVRGSSLNQTGLGWCQMAGT